MIATTSAAWALPKPGKKKAKSWPRRSRAKSTQGSARNLESLALSSAPATFCSEGGRKGCGRAEKPRPIPRGCLHGGAPQGSAVRAGCSVQDGAESRGWCPLLDVRPGKQQDAGPCREALGSRRCSQRKAWPSSKTLLSVSEERRRSLVGGARRLLRTGETVVG